jgi:hypothetical protein
MKKLLSSNFLKLIFLSTLLILIFLVFKSNSKTAYAATCSGGSCRATCNTGESDSGETCSDPALKCCITSTSGGGIGCGGGLGPIAEFLCGLQGKSKDEQKAGVGNQFNKIISTVIGVWIVIASIWFIIQIITAGFEWLNAGGDKSHLQSARDKILNAIIGLIIVVAAWAFIGVVGQTIGLDILNPGNILQNLGI